ncbi:tyrosine-type recombinase/integrase [Sulfurimonas sp.]|uniref:tyrosine-type recombinase/integrase n=1 Tax=Sulfurimonas sp. TaxID=2022749 RepID=UPI0025E10351|nr:tyrosine-type recombinase/integrase [Sulfurimonas sp.]
MQPFTLIVNKREKLVDYRGLKPVCIANRHCEYILQAKSLHTKTESSLYTETSMIRYLFHFLEQKDIYDLSNFTYPLLQELYAYLGTALTKLQKPLSYSSQRLVYTFFKSFSKWLYDTHPDEAPPFNIFMKSKFKRNNENLKTEIISDYALEQVKKAVRNENDIYTKAYILLLLYYGLRSIDIVSLKHNCLSMSDKDGKYDLHYIDHKAKQSVTIPAIASPVAIVISTLIHQTHDLRSQSGLEEIFIKKNRNGEIKILNAYQPKLLKFFVKQHDINNENGSVVHLTAHMFRRTLATNLQSSGASLEATQTVMNHKHKRTTMQYYIKTKNEEYIAQITDTLQYMQVISSKQDDIVKIKDGSILDNSLRLSDGYCVNEAMATDENYLCETFQKRGNCYSCSKMVTTPEFLPYFKNLYKEKEEEIQSKSFYGSHVIAHIEFEKDLIGMLIEKLETFGDIQ